MKAITVQLFQCSMLSEPINVGLDPTLNEGLVVRKDDLVLIGFPEFDDLVGIGLVKNTQVSINGLDKNDPFVMAKVTWPSKSVRRILASFRLNHLRIGDNLI